jgi:protein required for attachment to host cells
MKVSHNACVLVADGRKMMFLRNEGDAVHLHLVVEHAEELSNPADRDQKTDSAGRSGAMAHQGQNSFDESDFHQLAEDRFAGDAAELLKQRALAGSFESLIVVAPPRTLGELRKHYHVSVSDKLAGEIHKDLTGHSMSDIEAALIAA